MAIDSYIPMFEQEGVVFNLHRRSARAELKIFTKVQNTISSNSRGKTCDDFLKIFFKVITVLLYHFYSSFLSGLERFLRIRFLRLGFSAFVVSSSSSSSSSPSSSFPIPT